MVVPNVIGKFKICFQATTLSNHAGIVRLKEFTDRLGLPLLLDSQLAVKERERGYTESQSILPLCWNLILGGDCPDDLDVLRGDVGTQALLGLESVIAPTTAVYKWDFILQLERASATYAITADQTKQMRGRLQAIPEQDWKRDGHGTQAEVAEFWYAPDRQAEHRYLAKRERRKTRKGEAYWHYHVIITNDLRASARKVLHWALKRCTMENLIKEHKRGFGLEKMPTNNYHANWAWLLIGQLAFNIVAWFKRQVLPEQYHTAQIKTIRHHLLNVAGKIISSGKEWFLMLSDQSLFQDVWALALNRLADFKSG